MLTRNIGKNIFIEMSDESFNRVDEFLNKYGIKILWLFEDGVQFDYPPTLSVRYDPGDCTFIDTATGAIVLTYVENFGVLEFLDSSQEVIFSVNIIE